MSAKRTFVLDGTTREQADVIRDILRERQRQLAKWGPQSHADAPSNTAEGACLCLRLPTAAEAKRNCDQLMHAGFGTWGNILVEEVSEAIEEAGEGDKEKLREELVQVAAVAAAWIEDLDRQKKETADAAERQART